MSTHITETSGVELVGEHFIIIHLVWLSLLDREYLEKLL